MRKLCFTTLLIFSVAIGAAQSKINNSLVATLDTIFNEDQTLRLKSDTLVKQFGWKSKEVMELWEKIMYKDSINLLKVKNIINKYGWLGPDVVGKRGAQTIFLVIQHADSLTQVTYFPVMKKAVKKGKARPQDLAALEDRILTKQGKAQIYGTQVKINNETGNFEFFPIRDEPNVNKRRAAIGLEPIENYAKFFDIDYTLPKSKTKK